LFSREKVWEKEREKRTFFKRVFLASRSSFPFTPSAPLASFALKTLFSCRRPPPSPNLRHLRNQRLKNLPFDFHGQRPPPSERQIFSKLRFAHLAPRTISQAPRTILRDPAPSATRHAQSLHSMLNVPTKSAFTIRFSSVIIHRSQGGSMPE
jgi:hypothetical protein